MTPGRLHDLDDDRLLAAVADVWGLADPPPTDLAEGVLARLAVDELERDVELLTLVDAEELRLGVREGAAADADEGTVAMAFAGTSYRVLLRLSTVEGHRRIDGWVVPAVPMRVLLAAHGDLSPTRREASVTDAGRFELVEVPRGRARLWLLPEVAGDDEGPAPFATPLFLV